MCQSCLGSRASRSPSPTKLNAMTVRRIAAPGAVTRCGATKRKCRPSPIIDPHDGAGGATPRPRKESPASATMARAIPKVASTRIGESALGRMCRRRRRAGELPTARADSTNSLVLTESTCARITRAYPTHPRIERAKRTFPNEGPRTAAMPMASRIPGNASRTSQAPVKIRSAAPPRKPASDPTASPMRSETPTVPNPTASERRAPWISRERTSRPNLSCPSRWEAEGPDSPSSSFCASGSPGEITGAKAAARRNRESRTIPAAAPRCRAVRRISAGSPDFSLIPDPRIETGAQEVRRKVHRHGGQGDDEDAPLDQRVVPRVDRLDQQAADPGPGEDRLRDDASSQHRAERQPQRRDDGDEGVAQRVEGDGGTVRQTARGRGRHVLLPEFLQQRRADHPRQQGGHSRPERDGGKHEVAPRAVPGHREESPLHREEQHEQRSEKEVGDGKGEHRRESREVVRGLPAPHRREHPERQGDEDRHGDGRRGEQDGGGDAAGDLPEDRLPAAERYPEVPARDPREKRGVLGKDRPGQTQLPAKFLLLCGDRALPEHDLDGIPRKQVDQQEDDRDHPEHHGDGAQEATEEIALLRRPPDAGVEGSGTIRIARTGA